MRIAVLGLYNSGSTALAGVLHHLGVYMGGPPFFADYYEPLDVGTELRRWWKEPDLVESTAADIRVRWLADWLALKEAAGFAAIGIKHPLLCLSAPDVEQAWGDDVCYIWSKRSLEDSIAGLKRRNWYAHPAAMQNKLCDALNRFTANHEHLEIEYSELLEKPQVTIERLVRSLQLSPDENQVAAAAASIAPAVIVGRGTSYPRFY